jgi:hypothetical protein
MFSVVAYETSGSEAALTAITPVPDPTVAISGTDIRVPKALPNICAAAALINSAAATLRAQIQSPSLRAYLNFDISPINNGLVFGNMPRLSHLWDNPLVLAPDEPLDVLVQNGAIVMNRAVLWLCDGPIKPTTGKIATVRCTASATLATATWVNSALTFQQTLPAGHYQIVGARIWSANGVAARLYPVGSAWRPGVPMLNTEDQWDLNQFRFGRLGVWAEFDNTVPPTVDFLGVTDTAEVVLLDLIKTQ